MELAEILAKGSVLVCTEVESKQDVLHKLASQAARLTGCPADELFEALNARELLGSTGLGNGIAVPHGKFAGLKGVVAAFAKLEQPIDFEAIDDRPVDLIMMLLAPLGAGADHLKALARVARVLRSEAVTEGLRSASDPEDLYAILTQSEATIKAA